MSNKENTLDLSHIRSREIEVPSLVQKWDEIRKDRADALAPFTKMSFNALSLLAEDEQAGAALSLSIDENGAPLTEITSAFFNFIDESQFSQEDKHAAKLTPFCLPTAEALEQATEMIGVPSR